jgi:hypothetical protein
MNKPDNNFWDEVDQSNKTKYKKYLGFFIVILIVTAAAFGDYKYEKAHKTATISLPPTIETIQTPINAVEPQDNTPEIKSDKISKAETSTSIPQKNISSNQNNVQSPSLPPSQSYNPNNNLTQSSEHFVNFYYRTYTCYDTGRKSYEVVDRLVGDGGASWYVSDNVNTTLCSEGQYLLFSISRSSITGSKSIYFKPFDKYPPDYADDSFGDLITIKYDLNRTKIESLTYFGY